MEGSPINTAVMAFQNILNNGIHAAEEISVHLTEAQDIVGRGRGFPLERADVPDANGLVERSWHNEILFGMEQSAHDIVVVASQNGDASARLPVPDANGLVVAGADNPGILVVELHGADVVEVAEEREEAAVELVVPHLDFVSIAYQWD